jgi:hypothetical protein
MKYPHQDVYEKADMEQMRCQKNIKKAPKPPKEVPKTVGEAPVTPSK